MSIFLVGWKELLNEMIFLSRKQLFYATIINSSKKIEDVKMTDVKWLQSVSIFSFK